MVRQREAGGEGGGADDERTVIDTMTSLVSPLHPIHKGDG